MSLAKPKRGEPDEALGAGGGGGKAGGGGGGGGGAKKRLRKPSVKRWAERDCPRRLRRQSGKNVACYASFALVIAGLLGGTREVLGEEYVDAGDVSMDCNDCECTGSSDDGTITVFDNPSSGERVADVDGDLSEILETACGMSLIAVGDNLYSLSGVDLRPRDLEVVDMSSDDCRTRGTPDSADCYAGSTSKSLNGGRVEMDLDICLCSFEDDRTIYKANVLSSVSGTNDVKIEDGVQICLGNGFISYLVAATVDDETHYYNFDLAISGEDSSEDLSVSSAPPSSAEAFMCDEGGIGDDDGAGEGEDVEQAEPSPSPTAADSPTQGGVTGSAAPQPGLPTTTATISPVVLGTPAAVAPAAPPVNGGGLPPSTSPAVTLGPAGIGVATAAPTAPGGGVPTGVPVGVGPTTKPTEKPVASPAPGGGGEPTVAPGSADARPAEATKPPYSEDELAAAACTLPEESPCTLEAPAGLTKFGIGVYYDQACAGSSSPGEGLSGCGTGGVDVCRTCIFNTPLFNGSSQSGEGDVYVDCPCCVLDEYDGSVAINEDGPRCQSPSPAPSGGSVGGAGTTPTDPRLFDDRPRNLGGSEGLAVAALGLLGVLTFLPFCGK